MSCELAVGLLHAVPLLCLTSIALWRGVVNTSGQNRTEHVLLCYSVQLDYQSNFKQAWSPAKIWAKLEDNS